MLRIIVLEWKGLGVFFKEEISGKITESRYGIVYLFCRVGGL